MTEVCVRCVVPQSHLTIVGKHRMFALLFQAANATLKFGPNDLNFARPKIHVFCTVVKANLCCGIICAGSMDNCLERHVLRRKWSVHHVFPCLATRTNFLKENASFSAFLTKASGGGEKCGQARACSPETQVTWSGGRRGQQGRATPYGPGLTHASPRDPVRVNSAWTPCPVRYVIPWRHSAWCILGDPGVTSR